MKGLDNPDEAVSYLFNMALLREMGFTLEEQDRMPPALADGLLAIGNMEKKREWKYRNNLLQLLANRGR